MLVIVGWIRMFRFILFFLLFFNGLCAVALDNLVHIKSISKTGKTLVIGHGSIKNIQEGEIGAFFLKEGIIEKPQFIFLSEAKCIKVSAENSIWFLKDGLNLESMDRAIILMTKKNVLNGHVENKLTKKIIYSERDSIRNIHGSQSYPVWLNDAYQMGQVVDEDEEDDEIEEVSEKVTMNGDTVFQKSKKNSVEIDIERVAPEQGSRYINEFNQYTNIKLLKRNGDEKLGEQKERELDRAEILNLSKGSFAKVNSFEQGIIDLYSDVSVDKRDLVEEDSNISNSFKEYNLATKDLNVQDIDNNQDAKRLDDPLWPSGLSDIELRRYFMSHGLDEYRQRQNLVGFNKPAHEVLLRLSVSLNRNTTDSDPNYQSVNKSFYIGYEWHIMKASQLMRYFSIEMGVETTSGQYEVGNGINAYTYEFAGRLMLNYYLNDLPSAVNKLNWYVGVGGKAGNALVKSINLSQEYNYYQLSIPSFQAGVKYRFRAGDELDVLPRLGLGWSISVIADNHSFYNSRELFDEIKSNFYAADFKIVTGLGIFF